MDHHHVRADDPGLRPILEAIARKLGCDRGEWTLEFRFANGHLVRSHRHHGPIRNDELEELRA